MIRFRKIAVTALAALALTSCMVEGSESASAVKGTLEGKGYTVSVYSASTWFDENMSTFGRIFTGETSDLAIGLKNNVAYLGSKAAQTALGWTVQA